MPSSASPTAPRATNAVKCVVWDLDNTLWDGVLVEGDAVRVRADVVDVIRGLDERGILQSVASRNDEGMAMDKLRELGLDDYFLFPQIHWNSKVDSLKAIADSINIGIDTFAFVDDQPYERDEVNHALPQVLCVDAADAGGLLDRSEFNPRFVTPESRERREMYRNDIERTAAEQEFEGPKSDFAATLDMEYTIEAATEDDLQRAEELTQRTNQLNSTGYTYDYDDLNGFRTSDSHQLLVSRLTDRYGSYGTVGLALIEMDDAPTSPVWTIKLLLMSCRVMSRGVGTLLISHILRQAREAGASVRAELVRTGRNRPMQVAYMFAGFSEVERNGNHVVLAHDLKDVQPVPEFVTLHTPSTSH